jgi:hypothetical protein
MVVALGVSFSWVPHSGYPINNIDGSSTIQYALASHPFDGGDFAKGFVCFTQGFSVPAGVTTSLIHLCAPVAGPIDLHDTGKLTFDGDVYLNSSVSLTSGGIIDGAENTLFLGGDLTIPTGKTLAIASNTVINGCGHSLVFRSGSILNIDGAMGTTLTLKNIILKGVKSYDSLTRSLMFGTALNQELILDNVVIHLDDDIIFSGGELTIRDMVVISGDEYAFDYQSSYDCTIESHATLFMDLETMFMYEPADKIKTHLVFNDISSRLFLNGATLYAPSEFGLRLTDGHMIVDYKSLLSSDGGDRSTKGFEIGTGDESRDIKVTIAPTASLEIDGALVTYANQD